MGLKYQSWKIGKKEHSRNIRCELSNLLGIPYLSFNVRIQTLNLANILRRILCYWYTSLSNNTYIGRTCKKLKKNDITCQPFMPLTVVHITVPKINEAEDDLILPCSFWYVQQFLRYRGSKYLENTPTPNFAKTLPRLYCPGETRFPAKKNKKKRYLTHVKTF